MNKKEENLEFGWLDNPSTIVDVIILLIAFVVLLSQSLAVNNGTSTFAVMSNVINHNSIYLISLVYFISLKTKFGKKYFNYLNLFLIILYLIISITSLLTLFQSFSLLKIVALLMNVSIFTYLFHTLLKGTRLWKEFGLSRSICNEITNEMYFYVVVVLSVILLALKLIFTTSFGGTILTMFDTIYIILFSRYVYLFGMYLENKNTVDVDEIKEKVERAVSEMIEKTKKTVTKKTSVKKATTKKTTTKKVPAKKTSKSRGDK